METFILPYKKRAVILALGAESSGNFSVFKDSKIYFSEDLGDLLEEANWTRYQKAVFEYLKKNKIKPQIILTDLHPLYKTTAWGEELAKKFGAKLIQIQHHHAHIFSAIGDKILHNTFYLLPSTFYGIAMDGTGFGVDEKIWGGEIFRVESRQSKVKSIERIGHLENQIMIGGDLAVREPARMLIGILYKISCHPELVSGSNSNSEMPKQVRHDKQKKDSIYPFVKKYYTKNQFELIYNQLQQNFNCLETSSTGRVLDAISLLLDFCENKRNYKHEPIDLLEKNSTLPYSNLKPKIIFNNKEKKYILSSSHLFRYLLKNIKKDESLPADEAGRLASTAQLYIAEGLYEILSKCHPEQILGSKNKIEMPKQVRHDNFFISGGLANNKIISEYLISKGAYTSKIIPRGDAGLSFGQIIYYLLGK
ncbi:MAG: hypothetical protein WA055_03975 [Candidatus Moraniibacteriota bacterium]